MAVTFRPALSQDCDSVLPLIYRSGPAQFEYLFTLPGKPAHAFLRWSFATGLGLFGYRIYTIALVDQRPVAIGATYDRHEGKALERQLFVQILRFYGLRSAWVVIRRALKLDELTPFPEPGMRYIAQVSVAEAMQNQGIGTTWLRCQIELARENGYRRCALDVASTNQRAQALYERLGFIVTKEHHWPHAESAIQVPNMRRMELKLSPLGKEPHRT